MSHYYFKKFFTCMVFCMGIIAFAHAQQTFPVNGPHDKRPETIAFTNATLHTDYQTVINNATLLIKGNKIIEAGINVNIPKEAKVIDLKGKHIYPSFIDIYSDYGVPKATRSGDANFFREQFVSAKKGAYNWNQAVKPEIRSEELFSVNDRDAKPYRELGFGTVLTHQQDGIARGTSALVTLADLSDNEVVIKAPAAAHYSFRKGVSTQSYPSSLMGSVALLRQTFLDAAWYKANPSAEYNLSLDAWNRNLSLPQIFEAEDKMNILRADRVGDEFGKQFIMRAGGNEYQRIADIKATNAPLIVSVDFPEAYDVEDPYDAMRVSLADLKHWELAPSNPAAIAKAGIDFALTSAGLKNRADFLKNVQKAVEYGLDKKAALKALTLTPARLLGVDNMVGSLRKGMLANFLITSGELLEKNTLIHQNWIQGKAFELKPMEYTDIRGDYELTVGGEKLTLKITGEPEKHEFQVLKDTIKYTTTGTLEDKMLTLSYVVKDKGKFRLSGWVATGNKLGGEGQDDKGKWVKWTASQSNAFKTAEKKESSTETKAPEMGDVIYPFVAFGQKEIAKTGNYLIKNATVWTNEAEGILQNTDVIVRNGKIERVGKNLPDAGLTVIDGTGRHLTAGIIDEHSHIATLSVNEGVNSNSSEVRIGDVLNAEDINIYRQLAGGVVAAQILHGSANAIGGQSALIKLRWGQGPEQLKIQGADGFIKFALGENVKRGNSGTPGIRYPQTRMGVEQVYMDAFTRALEYEQALKTSPTTTRRDLQLDALVEILRGRRFITCHSYVQSEINMLIKVANHFGFKINTFTHILEGYKVADKMKDHGVNASTFADWWAYKFEVIDAIPQNAALMTNVGVNTAINSDDAEMARRLNQEAAKSVKYAGMSEEEAWKMVTLNPAKMLHLDNRMGSIKAGKDADLVLWNEHPLSVYARADMTMIEGTIYYDKAKDEATRQMISDERNRIIQKMIQAKGEGSATRRPVMRQQHMFHCEDADHYYLGSDADHDHQH